MILIIDNYDSFTYNLVHLVAENLVAENLAPENAASEIAASEIAASEPMTGGIRDDLLLVRRNDAISLREIRDLAPEGILISPGPGRPADAGISSAVVAELAREFPILGVCLGHQIIGQSYGGTVTYAPTLMHGKTSVIQHDGRSIFRGVPANFTATRYHSLVVAANSIPDVLEVSATTPDGVIMGLRHRNLPVEGIQFHPESILTVEGRKIIANWVNCCLDPHASIQANQPAR